MERPLRAKREKCEKRMLEDTDQEARFRLGGT